MKRILFDKTEITPIIFGGNIFGWTADEAKSFALLDYAFDHGINCIDTSNSYVTWIGKPGISEQIIGNWLKKSGKRNQVVIATKVGSEMGPSEKGLAKDYILKSAEDSLRRLQVDTIDLYQAHIDDENTPLEESLEAFDSLVKSGKVRAIGASNYKADRLQQCLEISTNNKLAVFQTLQPHYNLYMRHRFEGDLAKVAKQYNLKVMPYWSLAAGFLTGKYRSEADYSKSKRGPSMHKYLNERGLRILKAMDEIVAENNFSHAQLAIAWLLHQPQVTAPIVSGTSPAHIDQLLQAIEIKLDATTLEKLNQASAED